MTNVMEGNSIMPVTFTADNVIGENLLMLKMNEVQ